MMPRAIRLDDPDLDFTILEALETGQVLIFPTETVFGVGGNPWDRTVLERVRTLKDRPPGQPFTLHLPRLADVETYALPTEEARRWIERFLPGPYTFLLPARPSVPPSALRDGVVGIRVPDHPFFTGCMRRLGRPLFGASVNRRGERPLSDIGQIIECFPSVDLIVGDSTSGTPSTILDATTSTIRAVRGTMPAVPVALEEEEGGHPADGDPGTDCSP